MQVRWHYIYLSKLPSCWSRPFIQ